VCSLQAQTCKYCKSSFPGAKTYFLDWPIAKKGTLRTVVILVAVLMAVVLIVINILHS